MNENTKDEIIRHTLKLISQKGYDGFSVEELTIAAGCSKGIVFYHFTDRNNLIMEAFTTFLRYYGRLAEARLQNEKKAAKMLRVLTKVLTTPEVFIFESGDSTSLMLDAADFPRIIVNFYYLCMKSEAAANMQKEIYREYFKGIRQIIKHGIKKGEFKPEEDIEEIIIGYSAIIDGLLLYKSLGTEFYSNESADNILKNYWKRVLRM